ncbi:MAG: hypothetical protein QOF83_2536 [Solirubrobacteraceae bacterium]|jgi:hypothetical protein|nr:hypothetical protein [Solirubrobacteraceae bacterium]
MSWVMNSAEAERMALGRMPSLYGAVVMLAAAPQPAGLVPGPGPRPTTAIDAGDRSAAQARPGRDPVAPGSLTAAQVEAIAS